MTDMEFWLRLADSGAHAAHTRRIVGAYRVRPVSMSTVSRSHSEALMAFLRERHPGLMSAPPERPLSTSLPSAACRSPRRPP